MITRPKGWLSNKAAREHYRQGAGNFSTKLHNFTGAFPKRCSIGGRNITALCITPALHRYLLPLPNGTHRK